jgi:ring-1,2-phenylacetyl-CoA epoxidase subunit PaaE
MSQFHSLELQAIRAETARAMLLTFKVPPALAAAFRGEPGQHVVLRATLDATEQRRTYSVCARTDGQFSICVRSDGGGRMTSWLCGLRPGALVEVLPPTGRFLLPEAAGVDFAGAEYLAIAAGIGITPVIAIITSALALDPGARVTLLYGSRNTDSVLFAEELQALKDRHLQRLSLHFFMSREPQDLDIYDGRIGAQRLRDLAGRCFDPAALNAVFICAPDALITECGEALRGLGVAAARVHAEHFVTAATARAAAPHAATTAAPVSSGPASGVTRVTVRMDGRVKSFEMPREGEVAVLDAAAGAGLDLPFSCKGGVCSTCRTHVAKGSVKMLQNYALEDSEVEAGFVLACQAIPTSAELELDYDTG